MTYKQDSNLYVSDSHAALINKYMKTITLEATTDNLSDLLDIMNLYSNAVRFSYNRVIENKTEKEIRAFQKI